MAYDDCRGRRRAACEAGERRERGFGGRRRGEADLSAAGKKATVLPPLAREESTDPSGKCARQRAKGCECQCANRTCQEEEPPLLGIESASLRAGREVPG